MNSMVAMRKWQKRLPLLPADLEALYHHILVNIDLFYKQESSVIFQILQAAWDLADEFHI
jgi:hypothetical protein